MLELQVGARSGLSPPSAMVTMPVAADVYNHRADGEHDKPEEELEIENDDDILLWWHEHKLTYPILSIMARDIMFVPVSVSSKSSFSGTTRILEDRRQRLLPKHVEMLTCMKDWDQAARNEQHAPKDIDLEEIFNIQLVPG